MNLKITIRVRVRVRIRIKLRIKHYYDYYLSWPLDIAVGPSEQSFRRLLLVVMAVAAALMSAIAAGHGRFVISDTLFVAKKSSLRL